MLPILDQSMLPILDQRVFSINGDRESGRKSSKVFIYNKNDDPGDRLIKKI
ncbi:uncharacterized protein METZ01_LOCUS70293 [marine metagenome]|uniref:Uncharacterized protein n=1 Tax=marine metagenome TaxID=408172 RepID=A0A381TNN7_9ZZZZ